MGKEKMQYRLQTIIQQRNKQKNPLICNNMSGLGGHNSNVKQVTQRQIPCDHTFLIWDLKHKNDHNHKNPKHINEGKKLMVE